MSVMSSKNAARLSIFCAVLAVLVWLWESDTAMDAMVLFVTAGIIPGTGVVLTPEQMYIFMGLVMLLVVLLLCKKAMGRGRQNMRIFWRGGHAAVHAYREAVQQAGSKAVQPGMVVSVPALAIKHTRVAAAPSVSEAVEAPAVVPTERPVAAYKATSKAKHTKDNVVTQPTTEDRPVIVITVPGGPGHLKQLWQRMQPTVLASAGRVLEAILQGMHVVDVWVRRAIEAIRAYAVQSWEWAEPRIRTMDKQIEYAVKGNKHSAAALKAGDAAVKSAVAYSTLIRTKMGQRMTRTPEK